MIKVFLSHQSADSSLAVQISQRLKVYHGIESYLDVIDPNVRKGEDLAKHIQTELGKCTQLLAVVSERTQLSWWVPWEIGVATEKDYPLATYSGGNTSPPEFLKKWPYLRSLTDVDHYAHASKTGVSSFGQKRATLNESTARMASNQDFYATLRKNLGQ
ncbi:toll/interleukin-1 receptor domain-containing protein [Agrobacterium tumefaciens]|uniref:toll/interleukin-1 receptor domain-containing protein n=1 Tax=Agrobacterium tumefaciens TaxID=358 RepID=UPI001ADB454D|nr:toll/interleukin-1 receptor domain-containing protein [Agrobacterium tumefaciens]